MHLNGIGYHDASDRRSNAWSFRDRGPKTKRSYVVSQPGRGSARRAQPASSEAEGGRAEKQSSDGYLREKKIYDAVTNGLLVAYFDACETKQIAKFHNNSIMLIGTIQIMRFCCCAQSQRPCEDATTDSAGGEGEPQIACAAIEKRKRGDRSPIEEVVGKQKNEK